MTRWMCALGALGAVGCAGTPPTTTDTRDSDTGSLEVTPGETGRASLLVELTYPWVEAAEERSVLAGVFVVEDPGVTNLAHCLFGVDPWCATGVPVEGGDPIFVTSPSPDLRSSLLTLDAGRTVRVGRYNVRRNEDEGFVAYLDAADGLLTFDDPSLEVAVEGGPGWPGQTLPDVVSVPPPMSVLSHDPARTADFFDADQVLLRWLPAPGTVDLLISTDGGQTLQRLVDDGAHDLDLAPLGLAHESPVELRLVRSARGDVDVESGTLDLTVQHSRRFQGVYQIIGERETLTGGLPDTCKEAQDAPPLGEGHYEGTFVGYADDLDPGFTGCTGLAAAAPDAMVPVDVRPQQQLEVEYTLIEDDASIYLVSDCTDPGSCLQGVDAFGGPNTGGEELLVWTNRGPDVRRVYLVLDGLSSVTGPFRLSVELSSTGGDVLENFCADAIEQGPIEAGFYDGTLADHIDVLPGYDYPACETPGMFGGEGGAEIFLPAGSTLRATVDAPGADPRLLLLSNCSVAASCFAAGEREIGWTNSTPFGQTFFLVLDSATGIGEYALDVEIE